MIVSPFTPLFFISHKTDGVRSGYMQTFAPTDRIFLQLIGPGEWEGRAVVFREPGHTEFFDVQFSTWPINEQVTLRFASLRFSPGVYSVFISGIGTSEMFKVTENAAELAATTLIQYSMRDNRRRTDGVFVIDGMRRFFDFRVPGGFKDSNWSFGVDCEQFVTAQSDIVQLYARESTQKKFTLGTSSGCPVWFAEMLNRVLCCDYVYFDGERYARKETAVPETSTVLDGVNSFVFTQSLQRVMNLDPELELRNLAELRRIDNDVYRAINNGIPRKTT